MAFLSSTEAKHSHKLFSSFFNALSHFGFHSQPRVASCMYSYMAQKNAPVFELSGSDSFNPSPSVHLHGVLPSWSLTHTLVHWKPVFLSKKLPDDVS